VLVQPVSVRSKDDLHHLQAEALACLEINAQGQLSLSSHAGNVAADQAET
jgi:hypothetical protein